MRLIRIGIDVLQELNMDVSGSPSYTTLTINTDTLTAPLPDDYLAYRNIGVCINNMIIPLGLNKNIAIQPTFDDCGDEPQRQNFPFNDPNNIFNAVNNPYPYYGGNTHYNTSGEQIGRYYGVGGGQASFGQYIIDTKNNRIQFSSLLSGEVVLEYLASPAKSKGKYVVPPYIKEAVIAGIGWRSIQDMDGISQNVKEAKRRDYYNERRNANERINSSTLYELYQYIRTNNTASPKF